MPERIAALPIDPDRGYPIPFFVEWILGKPDFRIADSYKLGQCLKSSLCWTCGQPLGRYKAFVIGPMCAINRTASDPPSHRDCAEWSVKACPFLSRPKMVRREDDLTRSCDAAGEMIRRNPGVSLIWTTKQFRLFGDGRGGVLINFGDPESVSWWCEGRAATRTEVSESIKSGLPFLIEACGEPGSFEELARRRMSIERLLPKELLLEDAA